MRKACGESHMKSILAVGELCTLTNIYKASLVAMMAGSDFIKTSTGIAYAFLLLHMDKPFCCCREGNC